MPLTPESFPPWAPDILCQLYRERCVEDRPRHCDGLLERLISDPHMEKVWKSLVARNPDPQYPLALFLSLSVLTHTGPPPKSLPALKAEYKAIANLAAQLQSAVKATPLECPGLSALIERATDITDHADWWFTPYEQTLNKFTKNPEQTMLIRKLHEQFLRDFQTPLWETIALLVEVILDLPRDKSRIDQIRSTCRLE